MPENPVGESPTNIVHVDSVSKGGCLHVWIALGRILERPIFVTGAMMDSKMVLIHKHHPRQPVRAAGSQSSAMRRRLNAEDTRSEMKSVVYTQGERL